MKNSNISPRGTRGLPGLVLAVIVSLSAVSLRAADPLLALTPDPAPTNSVSGADLTLSWNAPDPQFFVSKHTVYLLQTSPVSNAVKVVDVAMPALNTTFTNLAPGIYSYFLTASNPWGESKPSLSVSSIPGLPPAPNNVALTQTVTIKLSLPATAPTAAPATAPVAAPPSK